MAGSVSSTPSRYVRYFARSNTRINIRRDPAQNIGALAAYPFAPYLSDGLGRKLTVWIGAVIMLAGVAVQAAAHNLNMFYAAR